MTSTHPTETVRAARHPDGMRINDEREPMTDDQPAPRPSFDLLREPCIDVIDHSGRLSVVSLRTMMVEAPRFAALLHHDAGSECGLLRLAASILQAAAFRRGAPARGNHLSAAYPAEKVTAYLDKWADRFDLFHPVYPFLQEARLTSLVGNGRIDKSPSALGAPWSAGVNRAFGYMEVPRHGDAIPAKVALGQLLAVLLYGTGQKAARVECSGAKSSSTPAGVLASKVSLYPVGDSLAQTLLLNLAMEPNIGKPMWEVSGELPSGLLGRMIWPSRLYLLLPTDDNRVGRVLFAVGHEIPDTLPPDPHQMEVGKSTLAFSVDQSLWQLAPTILGWKAAAGKSANPGARQAQWASNWLVLQGGRQGRRAIIYARNGIRNEKETYQRREVFPMPAGLLGVESGQHPAVQPLMDVLDETYTASTRLRDALRVVLPKVKTKSGAPEPALMKVKQMLALALQAPFWELVDVCAGTRDPNVIATACTTYRQSVRQHALRVFDQETGRLPPFVAGQKRAYLAAHLNYILSLVPPSEDKPGGASTAAPNDGDAATIHDQKKEAV